MPPSGRFGPHVKNKNKKENKNQFSLSPMQLFTHTNTRTDGRTDGHTNGPIEDCIDIFLRTTCPFFFFFPEASTISLAAPLILCY